MAELKNRITLE